MTIQSLQSGNELQAQIQEKTRTLNKIRNFSSFKQTHAACEINVEGSVSNGHFPLELLDMQTLLPDVIRTLESQIEDLQNQFDALR